MDAARVVYLWPSGPNEAESGLAMALVQIPPRCSPQRLGEFVRHVDGSPTAYRVPLTTNHGKSKRLEYGSISGKDSYWVTVRYSVMAPCSGGDIL